MGVWSDKINPLPFQSPPNAATPALGGKQLQIRGMANAAKRRAGLRMERFRQMMLDTQSSQPVKAGTQLTENHDVIQRFVDRILFGAR